MARDRVGDLGAVRGWVDVRFRRQCGNCGKDNVGFVGRLAGWRLAGWRLVGFPGGQLLFTPEDLESTQAFTREPIVGLQGRA